MHNNNLLLQGSDCVNLAGELHPNPKLSMFYALPQHYQHFLEK